jgi:hypothetical protein
LFTTQHYAAIAAMLKSNFEGSLLNEIALRHARLFADDNENFDAELFFEAAGMDKDAIELYKSHIIA